VIIIGVDPGSTTGLAVLALVDDRYQCLHVEQIAAGVFPDRLGVVVTDLLATGQLDAETQPALFGGGTVVTGVADGALLIATEAFVVRGRAARSRTHQGSEHARRINGWLESVGKSNGGCRISTRSASQVKKWATDRRLAAAGILEQTRGMGHARDAQRHALFAARMDLQWPDPLSVSYPKQSVTQK